MSLLFQLTVSGSVTTVVLENLTPLTKYLVFVYTVSGGINSEPLKGTETTCEFLLIYLKNCFLFLPLYISFVLSDVSLSGSRLWSNIRKATSSICVALLSWEAFWLVSWDAHLHSFAHFPPSHTSFEHLHLPLLYWASHHCLFFVWGRQPFTTPHDAMLWVNVYFQSGQRKNCKEPKRLQLKVCLFGLWSLYISSINQ